MGLSPVLCLMEITPVTPRTQSEERGRFHLSRAEGMRNRREKKGKCASDTGNPWNASSWILLRFAYKYPPCSATGKRSKEGAPCLRHDYGRGRTPSNSRAARRRRGPRAGPVHFIFTHLHLFSLPLSLIIGVVSDWKGTSLPALPCQLFLPHPSK